MKQIFVLVYSAAIGLIATQFNFSGDKAWLGICLLLILFYMWIYNVYGILKEDFKEVVKVELKMKKDPNNE